MNRNTSLKAHNPPEIREFFITCAGQMEEILKGEVNTLKSSLSLKIANININKGGVYFRSTIEDAFTLGLHLRTANRLLLNVKKIYFVSEKDLYIKALKVDWSQYISSKNTFKIDTKFAVGVDKKLRNSHFMSLKLKDAIVDNIREKEGKRPSISKDNPEVFIRNKIIRGKGTLQAHIFLDLFGEPLSRRGYRVAGHVAPLKEELAAAICINMGVSESTPLTDMMCGSGTVLIESFLIANDIGPQFLKINLLEKSNRKFSIFHWPSTKNSPLYAQAQKILADYSKKVSRNLQDIKNAKIVGFDNSKESIALTRKNIKAAGFQDFIKTELSDAQTLAPKSTEGILFCNPPYGDRIGELKNLEKLYFNLGENLKRNFKGHTAWIFTGNPDLRKKISLRTEKRITLYNGPIECRLLKYSLF